MTMFIIQKTSFTHLHQNPANFLDIKLSLSPFSILPWKGIYIFFKHLQPKRHWWSHVVHLRSHHLLFGTLFTPVHRCHSPWGQLHSQSVPEAPLFIANWVWTSPSWICLSWQWELTPKPSQHSCGRSKWELGIADLPDILGSILPLAWQSLLGSANRAVMVLWGQQQHSDLNAKPIKHICKAAGC